MCCPGQVKKKQCAALVADPGDKREAGAVAATGSWDLGDALSECGPGRYVAGVSHPSGDTGKFKTGSVHAVYCCSP